MTLKPFPGFKSLETHHCCTGALKHIYDFYNHPISEDMLLGIGGGVGFIYWHSKGIPPFIGGRHKGSPKQGFEKCAGERTGVVIEDFSTTSARKAESTMIELLKANEPVMFQLDMGFLPYFDFGDSDFHFGAHFNTACGLDIEKRLVLMADRDTGFHIVPLEDLANARGSTYKPFPPKNRWFTFDFKNKKLPAKDDVLNALREQIEAMLHPPISNLGVKGIRKAAKQSLKWPGILDDEILKTTFFNTYIFIDSDGGTGGGIFRYMFSRFLKEAGQILEKPGFEIISQQFKEIGDHWQITAQMFKEGFEKENYAQILTKTSARMLEAADMEEAAWSQLEKAIQ